MLDWRDHANITETYDILIGSDIVYFGCPVADLYAVFCKSLKPKGVGIIIIPERKNYSPLFLDLVEKDVFDV